MQQDERESNNKKSAMNERIKKSVFLAFLTTNEIQHALRLHSSMPYGFIAVCLKASYQYAF
jgi:hypothetical protein